MLCYSLFLKLLIKPDIYCVFFLFSICLMCSLKLLKVQYLKLHALQHIGPSLLPITFAACFNIRYIILLRQSLEQNHFLIQEQPPPPLITTEIKLNRILLTFVMNDKQVKKLDETMQSVHSHHRIPSCN